MGFSNLFYEIGRTVARIVAILKVWSTEKSKLCAFLQMYETVQKRDCTTINAETSSLELENSEYLTVLWPRFYVPSAANTNNLSRVSRGDHRVWRQNPLTTPERAALGPVVAAVTRTGS